LLLTFGCFLLSFLSLTASCRILGYLFYPRCYAPMVERYAALFSVPEAIVYAVIRTESHFDPQAVSHAGAKGLMQLMPATYEAIADRLRLVHRRLSVFSPDVNLACGVCLLSLLYEKYQSWDLVYAAYNAGEPAVDGWLADSRYSDGNTLIDIPYSETASYMTVVKRTAAVYQTLYHLSIIPDGKT